VNSGGHHVFTGVTVRAPGMALVVACTLALAVFGAAPASAQTVRGLVLEEVTFRPIELATVSLVSESGERLSSTLTTEEGFFSLEADGEGLFLVRVVALGYRLARVGPFDLQDDGLRVIEVTMQPQPVSLEGLTVEGEIATVPTGNWLAENGFWERYEEGRGQFLAPGDIAASDAMFTPHLFRELDHVVPDYGASPWTTWVTFRAASVRGNCAPRVYVDNQWMNRPFGLGTGFGLDEIVPIEMVYAVEVFWGPFQAPLKYQGTTIDNSCGVILIWTRRRG
jgi:Carboxypeptidase regulatory-like domain